MYYLMFYCFIFDHQDYNIGMKKIILVLMSFAVVFVFSSPTFASEKIKVKKGDSMWKIAQRYKVSFAEVLRLNKYHHVDADLIHVGDTIFIPDGSHGTNTEEDSNTDAITDGNKTADDVSVTSQAKNVLNLVNAERKKQGLQSLTLSSKLTSIATTKAQDMAKNNYFSHTSPTYGTPFQMLQTFGVSYSAAGENIAAGQKSASEVMEAWMNSSGHRANILSANFTELGVGYCVGGSYGSEWVQLFIGK